jgi:hypothetical protein
MISSPEGYKGCPPKADGLLYFYGKGSGVKGKRQKAKGRSRNAAIKNVKRQTANVKILNATSLQYSTLSSFQQAPPGLPPAGGEEKYNLAIILNRSIFQRASPGSSGGEEQYSLAIIFKMLTIQARPPPGLPTCRDRLSGGGEQYSLAIIFNRSIFSGPPPNPLRWRGRNTASRYWSTC